MENLYDVDGAWMTAKQINESQISNNRADSVESVIDEFGANIRDMQTEYKNIKHHIPEEFRLGLSEANTKIKIAEAIYNYRNGTFNHES